MQGYNYIYIDTYTLNTIDFKFTTCTDDAFSASHYGYKAKTLYIWRGILISCTLLISVLAFLTNGAIIYDEYKIVACRSVLASSWLGLVVLFDVISCVVNLILFIIPLRKATAAMREMAMRDQISSTSTHAHSQTLDSSINKSKSKSKDNYDKADSPTGTTHSPQASTTGVASGASMTTPSGGTTGKFKFTLSVDPPLKLQNTESGSISGGAGGSGYSGSEDKQDENSKGSSTGKNNYNHKRSKSKDRKKKKSKDRMKKQDKLVKVAKKFTFLTGLGVGTTFLAMLCSGLFAMPILWVGSDCIFNIVTVLLMFNWNKEYYDRLCKCIG